MEYFVFGNPERASEIRKFFKDKGYTVSKKTGTQYFTIYYTVKGLPEVRSCSCRTDTFDVVVNSKESYREIILPKFKVGDILQDTCLIKSSPVEVHAVDCERQLYVVINSKGTEHHLAFRCVHDNYDYCDKKEVTLPFKIGDLVLTRAHDKADWTVNVFSHLKEGLSPFACADARWPQCIPLKGNEHLAGTSQQCDKCYPPICYDKKNNA